jgi:hypothetical protein
VLLGLIHQYPDKARPEKGGYFQADHRKLWETTGMPKSVYVSGLESLAAEKLLTLGYAPAPGGGKRERGWVRIEFEAIEELLRFAWLRWAGRGVALYFRKHPLRRLKRKLAALETQAPI